MKKHVYLAAALACTLVLSACGDETTVNETIGLEVIAKGEKLAKCTDDIKGKMVFVTDSSEVFYCADGRWAPLNGENGKDGVDGSDGKNGSNGKDGIDGGNGSDGKDGTNCTATSIDEGIEVSCGGEIIDTLTNGANGKNGGKGADGIGCGINDLGNGKIVVTCGEEAKIDTLYKAMCGTESYDPAKKFCQDGNTYDLCGGESYDATVSFCQDETTYDLCDGNAYNVTEKFCQDETTYDLCDGNAYDVTEKFCQDETTYNLCDGNAYDVTEKFCQDETIKNLYEQCGNDTYSVIVKFCQNDIVYDLCNSEKYDATKQFCQDNAIYPLCNGEQYDATATICDTRDNQMYKFVAIGTQTWMTENLNYNGGSNIYLGDDENNANGYGRVYEPSSSLDSLCPTGWHVPTKAEFETLMAYGTAEGDVSSDVAKKFMSTSWGGTDIYGLNALPAGNCHESSCWANGICLRDVCSGNDTYAGFWSSSQTESGSFYRLSISSDGDASIIIDSESSKYYHSVRCVKN